MLTTSAVCWANRLNDLHVLDVQTMMWRRPNVDGNLPTPREHAALVPANSNSLLLFGGHGSGQRFNDLHYLDMESYAWQQPTIGGSGPSPRQVRKFVYFILQQCSF